MINRYAPPECKIRTIYIARVRAGRGTPGLPTPTQPAGRCKETLELSVEVIILGDEGNHRVSAVPGLIREAGILG